MINKTRTYLSTYFSDTQRKKILPIVVKIVIVTALIFIVLMAQKQQKTRQHPSELTSPPNNQSPTPVKRLPPCGKYGDINGDAFVTLTDKQMLQAYLAQTVTLTDQQKILADVDGNPGISVSDSLSISQYIAGVRPTFPVCPK